MRWRPLPIHARAAVPAHPARREPPALRILALDCSSEFCSAALVAGRERVQRLEHAGHRHSDLLLPMVSRLLADGEVVLSSLDGIAVAVGPGSFTSLRIAAAVAQGLAFGADLPVAAVSSLEALAWGTGAPRVLVCVDARMQEVYTARYDAEGEHAAPAVLPPALVPQPESSGWIGAGDGFRAHEAVLRAHLGTRLRGMLPDARCEALHVAAVALARHPGGFTAPPEALVPSYVRDKVARTLAER